MQRHQPTGRRHHPTGALATMCGPILMAMLGLVAAVLSGCGGDNVTASGQPAGPSVASVTLSPTSATITVGQQKLITATPKDATGNQLAGLAVAWASSAATVAAVDAGGTVTGIAAGNAVVTAAVGGKSASAAITVATPTYDGRWLGTTAQGDSLTFTVVGSLVSDPTIKFRLTGDCGIAGTTIHVNGSSGSVSGQQLTILAGTDLNVSGTFSSFDAASGTGSYTLRGSAPVCTSTSTTTWTARKS
jgi:Big-like domain-containing protein